MSENIPINILDAANAASNLLVPAKSKLVYDKKYHEYCEWKNKNDVNITNENVLLAFFYDKDKFKSSTLWTLFSMLKSMIRIHENIDIAKYSKLIAFIKRKKDNYIPKKSKVLTMENVLQFLQEAPDNTYLLMKTILIFGIHGACRRCELCNLLTTDIQDTGKIAIITLRDTKTKQNRIFTITDDCNSYYYYKMYAALRPENTKNNRFFLHYNKGKCTIQAIGINTIGSFPKQIAQFLKLQDSHLYTGHCFRRTSTTFVADSGAGIETIKRHGGWRSTSVAEGYIQENVEHRIQISKDIFKRVSHETALNKTEAQETITSNTNQTTTTSEETALNKTVAQETITSNKNQTTTTSEETATKETTSIKDNNEIAAIPEQTASKETIKNTNDTLKVTQCDSIPVGTQVALKNSSILSNVDISKFGPLNINNINSCVINIYPNK